MRSSLEDTVTSVLARGQPSNQHELDELCARVTPALTAWARLQLGPGRGGRLEPEELVQEVWVRAMSALNTFDASKGPFRAWLIGIGRNVLLEALRSSSRRSASSSEAFSLAECPDSVTSITRAAARSDALAHLIDELSALAEQDRVLVVCCGLEGLPATEAALRLGITPAAAAKRWQRLRESLWSRADVLALLGE